MRIISAIPRTELQRLAAVSLRGIGEDVRKGDVSAGDARKAREKVIRVSTELRKSEVQRAERKERRRVLYFMQD